jgi:hypothetical protein
MSSQSETTLAAFCRFFEIAEKDGGALPITLPHANRQTLASFFAHMGFNQGAEIGVESGRYARDLCAANLGLHLYCVDAWQSYGAYRQHVSQQRTEWMLERTRERLAGFSYTIIRKFSVEAAAGIEDGSLDFVYIDANHAYEHVVEDIAAWLPKVRSGGIISGHDYAPWTLSGMPCGVVEAVNGWTKAYRIKPWFLVGHTGIAPGDTRPRPQSWLWIKD